MGGKPTISFRCLIWGTGRNVHLTFNLKLNLTLILFCQVCSASESLRTVSYPKPKSKSSLLQRADIDTLAFLPSSRMIDASRFAERRCWTVQRMHRVDDSVPKSKHFSSSIFSSRRIHKWVRCRFLNIFEGQLITSNFQYWGQKLLQIPRQASCSPFKIYLHTLQQHRKEHYQSKKLPFRHPYLRQRDLSIRQSFRSDLKIIKGKWYVPSFLTG